MALIGKRGKDMAEGMRESTLTEANRDVVDRIEFLDGFGQRPFEEQE